MAYKKTLYSIFKVLKLEYCDFVFPKCLIQQIYFRINGKSISKVKLLSFPIKKNKIFQHVHPLTVC